MGALSVMLAGACADDPQTSDDVEARTQSDGGGARETALETWYEALEEPMLADSPDEDAQVAQLEPRATGVAEATPSAEDARPSGGPIAAARASERPDARLDVDERIDQLISEAYAQERSGRAYAAYEPLYEALELADEGSLRRVEILVDIANLAMSLSTLDRAERLFEHARTAAQESPNTEIRAELACGQARLSFERGDADQARLSYSQCLVLSGELDDDVLIFEAQLGLLVVSPAPPSREAVHRLLLLAEQTGRSDDVRAAERLIESHAEAIALWRESGSELGFWEWMRETGHRIGVGPNGQREERPHVSLCRIAYDCWLSGERRLCRTPRGGVITCPIDRW